MAGQPTRRPPFLTVPRLQNSGPYDHGLWKPLVSRKWPVQKPVGILFGVTWLTPWTSPEIFEGNSNFENELKLLINRFLVEVPLHMGFSRLFSTASYRARPWKKLNWQQRASRFEPFELLQHAMHVSFMWQKRKLLLGTRMQKDSIFFWMVKFYNNYLCTSITYDWILRYLHICRAYPRIPESTCHAKKTSKNPEELGDLCGSRVWFWTFLGVFGAERRGFRWFIIIFDTDRFQYCLRLPALFFIVDLHSLLQEIKQPFVRLLQARGDEMIRFGELHTIFSVVPTQ